MKRGGLAASIALVVGLVAGGGGSLTPAEEAVIETGVRTFRTAEGRFVEATLPGIVVSHVIATTAGEGRGVWFLLAPVAEPEPQATEDPDDEGQPPPCPDSPQRERPPRSLHRLDVRGAGSLTVVREDLPGDADSIAAADLDGDGFDEIVLVRKSGVYSVRGGDLHPLVEGSDLGLAEAGGRSIVLETTTGGARLYGPRLPGQTWALLAEVDLPAKGRLRGRTLTISRKIPTPFGSRENGSLLLATRPESAGKYRVSTTVIEVSAEGKVTVVESWSRLPAAEDVLDRRLLTLDDEAILLVTTKPAGKLALFAEKGLRLYPVEHDRTHLGLPPRFAVDSHMNLWQEPVPAIVDVNGDGLKDLVLGYWKGIMGARVVLDAYVREEDGSFSDSVRTTAFDVKNGERSLLLYGDDLDGDGLPDLLILAEGELRLHRGLPSKRGAKLVDRTSRVIPLQDVATDENEEEEALVMELGSNGARYTTELGTGRHPRVADLDGDGRKEIYVVGSGQGAAAAGFRAIWLAPAP